MRNMFADDGRVHRRLLRAIDTGMTAARCGASNLKRVHANQQRWLKKVRLSQNRSAILVRSEVIEIWLKFHQVEKGAFDQPVMRKMSRVRA
jgi:hypothetical protein